MDKGYPFSIASVLILLSLTGGVSAGEETVSISVDVPMKGYPGETTNVSSVTVWNSMDIALGEDFTFTFIADNLVNGTEYAFSYEIGRYAREDYVNASHLFVANNTEEYSYNLEGQFNHTDWSNCSKFSAKVSFVKNPNGTNETLATFQTNSFRPSGYISEECYGPYSSNNDGGLLGFLGLLLSPIFFIFTVYKIFSSIFRTSDTEVADDASGTEEGTNSNQWALFWLMMMIVSILMFFNFSLVML